MIARLAIGALLAAAVAPAAAAERAYELQAADGLPGAYRVTLQLESAGAWRFAAEWSGRGLAGLWLEDASGTTVARQAGATPLALVVDVGGSEAPGVGERVVLRFAPMTARGELRGRLRIVPPAPSPAQAPSPPRPARLEQPRPAGAAGSCLERLAGDDVALRGLGALAESAAAARPDEREWLARWSAALQRAASLDRPHRLARDDIDRLWQDMALDPPPGEALARAFRGVLAVVEDLVRLETAAPAEAQAGTARERREQVLAALGCLVPPS
ncbi:MAG: hypothetical protein KBD01_14760 [Acidobacteria bacterium]|nr:hypothetical protein [Acidobacteriota bacterium]